VNYGGYCDYVLQNSQMSLKYLAYCYIFLCFCWLVYPNFNFKYIFSAPNFIYSNTLEAARASVATPIGKSISSALALLYPFCLLYYSMGTNRKKIALFLLFDLYVQYLMGQASIGRLAIIKTLLVLCFYYFSTEHNKVRKQRLLIVISFVSVLSIVLYFLLESWRGGNNISITDVKLLDSVGYFADSEFSYPSHYPLAESLYNERAYDPLVFWIWLFTLPIPKAIFAVPYIDSYTCLIYRVFTYYYWDGHWGNESGYAGRLLSVVGDGIMVYGPVFAFILIIPFAFFIGYFLRFIKQIKYSEAIFCNYVFMFVVSFRPGVQYALQYINTFVGILLIVALINLFPKNNKDNSVAPQTVFQ
jgi:hypothetical protein